MENKIVFETPDVKYVSIDEIDYSQINLIQKDMQKIKDLKTNLMMELLFLKQSNNSDDTKIRLKRKLLDKVDEKLKQKAEMLKKLEFNLY